MFKHELESVYEKQQMSAGDHEVQSDIHSCINMKQRSGVCLSVCLSLSVPSAVTMLACRYRNSVTATSSTG